MTTSQFLHGQLTEQIISAFFQVYRELGYGFLESVYEKAMTLALEERGLRCTRQAAITVSFHGKEIGRFRADIIVDNRIIVELKAVRNLEPSHEAQLLNCLKATSIEVGLLLNFGPRHQFRRLVFANSRKESTSPSKQQGRTSKQSG